ncbi:MAG: nuclear transport factor 2 family protein [bacterium]
MRASLVSLVALALLTLAGCKDDPTPVPPAPATPPRVATPPGPVTPPEPAAAPVVDVQAARALVDRWLAAQNAGDFEAYQALYAPRFYGVKRAGDRTTNFDRAGWIGDRRRMFQRPMKVDAEGIEVVAAAGAARVRFIQSWSSGNYRDVGPKQLVLTKGPEGLLIAREEMIASTVLDPAVEKGDDALDFRFAMVLDAPYVVLGPAVETAAAPIAIGNRRPRAARAAAPGEAGRAYVGRQVTLYGTDGRLCQGRVVDTHVVARVIPHFGIEQEWKGEMDPSDGGKPTSDEEITRQVWSMSADGGRVLAGRVDAAAGACGGALWARFEAEGAAPVALWQERPPQGDQEARAWALVRGTDEFRAIQGRFMAEVAGAEGTWDQAAETRAQVQVWRREGAPEVVVVSADAGPGCGGFGGGMWQAFVDEKRTLRPLGKAVADGAMFSVRAVADLDGDGTPELIGVEGYGGDLAVYGMQGGERVRLRHLPVLDLDTPC